MSMDICLTGLSSLQLNRQQLQGVKDRFLAFLNGETQIVADEAFCNAVRSYYEVSLPFFFAVRLRLLSSVFPFLFFIQVFTFPMCLFLSSSFILIFAHPSALLLHICLGGRHILPC